MQMELVIYFWPCWLKLWRIILIHFLVLKNLKSYFEQIIQEMLLRFLKNIRFLNGKRYEIPFRIRGGFLSGYPILRQKIPILRLTKSWAIPTIKNPESRGKFQNNSLLEKFLLQKESGEINPDPRALGFLGFSSQSFFGNFKFRSRSPDFGFSRFLI